MLTHVYCRHQIAHHVRYIGCADSSATNTNFQNGEICPCGIRWNCLVFAALAHRGLCSNMRGFFVVHILIDITAVLARPLSQRTGMHSPGPLRSNRLQYEGAV